MAKKTKTAKKPSVSPAANKLPKPVAADVDVATPERAGNEDDRFWWIAFAILFVGIALRQLWLMNAPYSHDEAIHAVFSRAFITYNYDPVYHGPLLYHLVATVFAVLGDNDFTARLVPSLLGIVLLALVIGPARRHLGERGALWSTALLAISPVMVTYHRRLIHDALVLALTFGAVLCCQTARENAGHTSKGRLARIGLATLLALFVATKANAFFIIAMLIAFWMLTKLPRLALDEDGFVPLPPWLPAVAALVCVVVGWLFVAGAEFNVALAQTISIFTGSSSGARGAKILNAGLALTTLVSFWMALQWRVLWRGENKSARAPHWLPMASLLIIAVASYCAVRESLAIERNERMLSLVSVLALLALWEWLRRAPRIDENTAAAESDVAVGEPELRKYLPGQILTLLLAAGAAAFVFAFLYGHGYIWIRQPSAFSQYWPEIR